MKAREHILDSIRKGTSGSRNTASPSRPETLPANAIPADIDERIALFSRRAEESGARIIMVRGSDSSGALTDALQEFFPLYIPDSVLEAKLLPSSSEAVDTDSRTTLVRAHAALAETGTVCLNDGRVASEHYFLCEQLLIFLRAEDVLGCQEDYWRTPVDRWPHAIHLVTGPSRTADVEQTLQIGAHGPKSVTIFIEYSWPTA